MTLKTWWPETGIDKALEFGIFAQRMANRLIVGMYRYDRGRPTSRAKYLQRLKVEIKAYDESGNQEHLINAANYAFLEMVAPEHPKSHFKEVDFSVTRDNFELDPLRTKGAL